MGLGKSIQALGIASYYRAKWPLLIIAPASLRQVWSDQLFMWLDNITPDDVTIVMNSKNDVFRESKIAIISYELVDRIGSNKFTFGVVIVDESHHIKSWKAKRTLACQPVIERAAHVILLSGTPALSKPSELFPQLSSLRRDLFRGFRTFAYRYCNPVTKGRYTTYDGCDNVEELFAVLRETVMLRRLKGEVLSELPPKQRVRSEVLVDESQKEMMARITKRLTASRMVADGRTSDTNFDQLRMVIELFNDSGRAKITQVLAHLKAHLLQHVGEKVIVFGHHKDILSAIEALTRQMKVGTKYCPPPALRTLLSMRLQALSLLMDPLRRQSATI